MRTEPRCRSEGLPADSTLGRRVREVWLEGTKTSFARCLKQQNCKGSKDRASPACHVGRDRCSPRSPSTYTPAIASLMAGLRHQATVAFNR